MLPQDQKWSETSAQLAFGHGYHYILWLPGTPMPPNMVDEIIEKVQAAKQKAASAPPPQVSAPAQTVPVHSAGAPQVFCTACGAPIHGRAFCMQCGHPAPTPTQHV